MMLKLVFELSDAVCSPFHLAGSEFKLTGAVAGGFIVLVIALVIFAILFLVLGLYLIRKGIISDSSVLVVLGILITGFWIGLLYWLIIKDSPSLKKQRDLVYKNKEASKQKDIAS